MKTFLLFTAVFTIHTAAMAQKAGGITGKIINESGQPVEDAIVTLLQDSTKAITSSITDATGNYRIRPIKPGNYSVRVTERFHEVKTLYDFPIYKNKFVVLDVTLTQPGIASRQVIKMVKGGTIYSYEQDSIVK
jgi:uncharacterized surface anchored protein